MATYYVGPGGSNAAAGTSYALRWLTLAKALGAAGIASGDTLYVTPGTYREVVTVAMTSAVANTFIIGDTDGSHTSGVPGPVIWTSWTTSDTAAASASAPLDLAGRDFLSFSNIVFMAQSASCVAGSTATSTNITFTDCFFNGGPNTSAAVTHTTAAGVASNWTLDRCHFHALGASTACLVVTFTRHTADYDANIVVTNSVLVGITAGVIIQSTGAGVGFGGGVKAKNCTIIGTHGIRALDANISAGGTAAIGADVKNSLFLCNTGVRCSTATAVITEDHNLFSCATARTNVAAGTGSQTAYAPSYHFGQERLYAGQLRPMFTPTSGAPILGFTSTSPPAVDGLNRLRPSGGASLAAAAGAFERHEYGVRELVTIDTGGLAIKLTGPGDHQFPIPVTSGVQRNVSLKVNYDATHGTGTPPQAELVANATVGFPGETITAAASTGTFLTLTFTAFTPTASGYVYLRLKNRAAAGGGVAIFDTVSIT